MIGRGYTLSCLIIRCIISCRPIEKLRYVPNMKKHISMVAGGSCLTSTLQVIDAILQNLVDTTKASDKCEKEKRKHALMLHFQRSKLVRLCSHCHIYQFVLRNVLVSSSAFDVQVDRACTKMLFLF